MKNALLILACIGTIVISGCNEDCDEWFEKEDKDCIEMREKFYGYYVGVYTQNGQTSNGFIELTEFSGNVQRVKFGDSSNYLELTGSSTFDLPLQQVVDIQGTYTLEGTGSLNGNQLVLNATQTFNGQTVILNFTGTK